VSRNKNFCCAYFSMHFRIKFLLLNDFPWYIFSEFDLFCNIVQLLLLSATMTNAVSAPFCIHTVYIYICLYKCCLCNCDCFHNFGSMECETKVKITNYLCCRFLLVQVAGFCVVVLHCCVKLLNQFEKERITSAVDRVY
jgi:hypothetical protein